MDNSKLRSTNEVVRDSYKKPGDTPTLTAIRSMRRDELRRTLQFNGYDVQGDPSKEITLPQVLNLYMEEGFKFPQPNWRPGKDEANALVKPEGTLDALGVFALRKLCKERGIPTEKTDKKVDLLEKLNGGDTS